MDLKRLQEILALRDKATKLPWRTTYDDAQHEENDNGEYNIIERDPLTGDHWEDFVVGFMYYDGLHTGMSKDNARYVVAVANAFPQLATAYEVKCKHFDNVTKWWTASMKENEELKATVSQLARLLSKAEDKAQFHKRAYENHVGPSTYTEPNGPADSDSCMKIEGNRGECDGSCEKDGDD